MRAGCCRHQKMVATIARRTDMLQANAGTSTEAGHEFNTATSRRRSFDHNFPRAPHAAWDTGFRLRAMTHAGCALALLLFAGTAIARDTQTTASHPATAESTATATGSSAQAKPTAANAAKPAATAQQISYVGGQLTINVLDSTLADVLAKVAALTGMKLDVPPGASAERMPVVELGPGPARQVLASLLDESTFDFVIQASATDPEKMQSVTLMTREKKP